MVQFLNSPQQTIPVREDPMMSAISGIASLIMAKMGQNQATRAKGDVENAKQVQELMSTFIQKGATPQEAQAVAMKMAGNYKPDDQSKPWLMQDAAGRNTMVPNIANIWGDMGEKLNNPAWQGPATVQSKEPMSYQKLDKRVKESEITKNLAAAKASGNKALTGTNSDNALKIAALKAVYGDDLTNIEFDDEAKNQKVAIIYKTLKTMDGGVPMASDVLRLKQPKEGDIVINKKTGEKQVLRGGKWQPTK